MNPKWENLYNGLRRDPSALRPQDDPSLSRKFPKGSVIWIIVLLCIFLLPFLSPDVFKLSAHCIYGALSASLLFLALRTRTYLKNRAILLCLSAWLVVVVVTSFFSLHPRVALNSALYFLFYAVVFTVVAGLDYRRKKQIAVALIAGSFFISMRGLLQYFLYFDKIVPYITTHGLPIANRQFLYISDIAARRRVISTFNTPNLLASYLAMVNLVIFGYLFINKNKKAFFLLLALLIINSCCLYLTRSLAGLAGFVFGISLFFLLYLMKKRQTLKRPNRFLAFSVSAVFILFVALFISRFFYESGVDNLSVSLQGRLQFWKAALYAIAERPLSFAGLGNFGYIYRIYAPSAAIESTMAHNFLLQLWVETGLYGLLAFIWFLVILIFTTVRNVLNTEPPAGIAILRIGVLSAVSAFLFHNMAGFSFFTPQVAIIWWVLSGLMVARKQ